jgi:hypothetical protein
MNVRRVIASVAIFAVVVTGIGVSILLLFNNRHAPPAASPKSPVPVAPRVPTPAEFLIGVVVTDQNCSGPSSCVYKYRIEPNYIGNQPLPDKEIKVVYQVTGGHQPQVGDFTLQGTQARVLQDVPLEGPPGARLQASVTRIVG